VAEALRAAYILKVDLGLETRVVNMHTVKPMDEEAVIRSGLETKAMITAEEHQIGGLGNRVAAVLSRERKLDSKVLPFDMIGIADRFGQSGKPWQLIKEFGVAAEHIAVKAREILSL